MLIRNIDESDLKPVTMPGVSGATMAVMVGRADGAPNFALRQFKVEPGGFTPRHSHDYEHEVYIVAGGGTLIDRAKVFRRNNWPALNLVAIPTIWGSGAEVSPVAVLTGAKKDIHFTDDLIPDPPLNSGRSDGLARGARHA